MVRSMIPRILLGTAPIPDTKFELRLYQSGEVFSITILGRGDLMTSRMHGSEQALAELACERLAGRKHPWCRKQDAGGTPALPGPPRSRRETKRG